MATQLYVINYTTTPHRGIAPDSTGALPVAQKIDALPPAFKKSCNDFDDFKNIYKSAT